MMLSHWQAFRIKFFMTAFSAPLPQPSLTMAFDEGHFISESCLRNLSQQKNPITTPSLCNLFNLSPKFLNTPKALIFFFNGPCALRGCFYSARQGSLQVWVPINLESIKFHKKFSLSTPHENWNVPTSGRCLCNSSRNALPDVPGGCWSV